MANVRRLVESGMPPELAKEIARGSLEIGTSSTTAMAGNRTPTVTIRGGVLQQPAIANVAAAPTMADFNRLLAALRSAGVLAT